MEHHFDWIWEHASIPVSEYVGGEAVGTDDGIHRCGAVNVYVDARKASERILHLLKQARQKISIQGVSLQSFFRPGELREAISDVLEKGDAEVEVLLLDPECEQAKYRSYRERLIVSEEQGFEDYLEKGQHEHSELHQDTLRTLQNVAHMVEDIRRRRQDRRWMPRLKVALYASAPACFVLRIDDRVLVEQYHYGKIAQHARAILGKDMPLFEYAETQAPLYTSEGDRLRRPLPFDLLVDHFQYALDRAREANTHGQPPPALAVGGVGVARSSLAVGRSAARVGLLHLVDPGEWGRQPVPIFASIASAVCSAPSTQPCASEYASPQM